MLAKVHAAQTVGLKADIVDVEIDVSRGLHSFTIVGLPDKAVEEAKDRISAAIKNSGFASPQKSNRKVIVSLAPADLKKEGPVFDLAIALAYLAATEEVAFNAKNKLFVGELALDGQVRPIKGALLVARKAAQAGFNEIYVPTVNASEAALVSGITVYGVTDLQSLTSHLATKPATETTKQITLTAHPPTHVTPTDAASQFDLAEIRGQETAKRGLEIAAAGGHNLAMYGPPGTGKTMLARAFAALLPPLSFNDILDVTGIHSAAGALREDLVTAPPFRSPHHTASYVSLVGGGTWPRPGEITLAHRGVLFLDEFPEFEKKVIEALRQPLEDRVVHISRARGTLSFPANFILIAAMNPCPCGNKGTKGKQCICSQAALVRYRRKLSGPIIDRIDLWLEVGPIDHAKLSKDNPEESSGRVRERVLRARERQVARFTQAGTTHQTNSEMGVRDLKQFAPLSESLTQLLNTSAKRLDLSARAYHRIIKLARTIADLEGATQIGEAHLLEALQYRPKIVF